MNHVSKVIALIIFTGYAGITSAETDYRCLTLCVDKGQSSASCMKECSYNNLAPSPTPAPPGEAWQETLKYSHRQFAAPVPVKDGLLLPSKNSDSVTKSGSQLPPMTQKSQPLKEAGYACVAKCEQKGMEYAFCEEKCAQM